MIARIIYILLTITWLPECYLTHRLRKNGLLSSWKRLILWWLPTIIMTIFALKLALEPDFAPHDMQELLVYLFLLGVYIVPKAVYVITLLVCRKISCLKQHLLATAMAAGTISLVLYGVFVETDKIQVENLELEFDDLPQAFDGYRIVHISDIHAGSYVGERQDKLARTIDTVNRLGADAILFTGDLQNARAEEITEKQEILQRLSAKDGVFSVLGNHDYSDYLCTDDPVVKHKNEHQTIVEQRKMGWKVLLNEHQKLYRGQDSIVIAGLENASKKQAYSHEDIPRAMDGIEETAFVVMMQHNPWLWRTQILPNTHAQLTLSGHTHGGQINLLGLRLTRLTYREDKGLYQQEGRYLFVTSGLGGVFPFRLGMPSEIAVITLKRKKH